MKFPNLIIVVVYKVKNRYMCISNLHVRTYLPSLSKPTLLISLILLVMDYCDITVLCLRCTLSITSTYTSIHIHVHVFQLYMYEIFFGNFWYMCIHTPLSRILEYTFNHFDYTFKLCDCLQLWWLKV